MLEISGLKKKIQKQADKFCCKNPQILITSLKHLHKLFKILNSKKDH